MDGGASFRTVDFVAFVALFMKRIHDELFVACLEDANRNAFGDGQIVGFLYQCIDRIRVRPMFLYMPALGFDGLVESQPGHVVVGLETVSCKRGIGLPPERGGDNEKRDRPDSRPA